MGLGKYGFSSKLWLTFYRHNIVFAAIFIIAAVFGRLYSMTIYLKMRKIRVFGVSSIFPVISMMNRFFSFAMVAFVMLSLIQHANAGKLRSRQIAPRRSYQDFDWKGNPEEILKQQLAHVKYWKELMKFLDDPNGNIANFDPNNLPKIKLDEETMSSLKKIVENWKANTKTSAKKVEEIKKALKKAQAAKKVQQKNGAVTAPAKSNPPAKTLKPPEPPAQSTEERISEWLQDMASDMGDSDFGQMLQQSPAWRNTIEELQKSLLNPSGKPGGTDWGKLVDGLPFPKDFDFSWAANGFGKLENMSPPEMPNWSGSAPNFGKMPVPSIPGGGRSAGWSLFQIVMWSIFAVVIVVLAWVAARRLRFSSAKTENTAWRLGPWPVNLSQITTQAEFIKAFDYLAMLLLGREICTKNHHEIADKLSGESAVDDEKRRAVENLTQKYEQARYAPAEQPITAEMRRQLQLIAGQIAS